MPSHSLPQDHQPIASSSHLQHSQRVLHSCASNSSHNPFSEKAPQIWQHLSKHTTIFSKSLYLVTALSKINYNPNCRNSCSTYTELQPRKSVREIPNLKQIKAGTLPCCPGAQHQCLCPAGMGGMTPLDNSAFAQPTMINGTLRERKHFNGL